MNHLEEIDAMILRELLSDGRKSFTSIAKELQTTKDVIWKRYKNMEKARIITGATIQFNFPCFGYESIATIALNVNSELLNNVLQNLQKIPDVLAMQIYNSPFNIMVITTFKSLKDLENIKSLLRSNPINAYRTNLWTDVRNTPENLTFGFSPKKISVETTNKVNFQINTGKDCLKLNEIDNQIVRQLIQNGQMSFNEIAKIIGVSTDTVSRRYARLERNGYIKASIQINPVLVGYRVLAMFFLSILAQDNIKLAIEEVGKIPNVSYIAKITGDYEIQFTLLVRDLDELIEVNKKIIQLPGIEKIEMSFREVPPAWPGPRQYITTF
jgi:Lrp/AsnC family transcriptional regulator, regulator for asnA, asnC and gidA